MTQPPNVFISYAFEEDCTRAVVERLKSELRDAETPMRAFAASPDAAQTDMQPGDPWPTQICENVRGSKALIFILDAASAGSTECFKELLLAQGAGIPVLAYDISPETRLGGAGSENGFVLRYLNDAEQTQYEWTPGNKHDAHSTAEDIRSHFLCALMSAERPSSAGERASSLVDKIAATCDELAGNARESEISEFELVRDCLLDIGRLIFTVIPCDAASRRTKKLVERCVNAAMQAERPKKGPNEYTTNLLRNDLNRLAKVLGSEFGQPEVSEGIRGACEALPNPGGESHQSDEPRILVEIDASRFEGIQLPRLQSYTSTDVDVHLGKSKTRTLTPVVGNGALQLRNRATDKADPDADEDAIAWDTRVVDHSRSDNARAGFLNDILDTRCDGRSRYEENGADEAVSNARIALFELAFLSTKAFLENLKSGIAPIADWEDLDVVLPIETTNALVDSCETASTMLDPVDVHGGRLPALLGGSDLKEKLDEFVDHQLTDGEGTAKPGAHLPGKSVEWITDVFWHSMVFDSPLYPRMDELALQVSLVDGSSGKVRFRYPLQRLEPAASVYRFDVGSFTAAVRDSVHRGFIEDDHVDRADRDSRTVRESPRRRFYGALADSLMCEFESWESDDRPSRQDDSLPVAVVATFDLELERALMFSEHGSFFHVALPVLVSQGDRLAELRWIVGTFSVATPDLNRDAPHDQKYVWRAIGTEEKAASQIELLRTPSSEQDWQWLDDMERYKDTAGINWKGPLVLKINGSPVHKLPKNAAHIGERLDTSEDRRTGASDELPSGPDIHHAVSLAEFDFLQTSRAHIWANSSRSSGDSAIRQGLPKEITDALRHSSRYWVLAGYRLVDWNSRMQLFMYLPEHLRHDTQERSKRKAIAINKTYDHDRVRILTWLGVEPYRGDLRDLTKHLVKYAATRRNNSTQEASDANR